MYLKNRYHGYAFVRFLDLIEFDHICIFGRLKFCKLTPAFSIRHIYSQKLNLGRNCIKARKAESDLEFRKKWMWTRQWSVCQCVPNGHCPCCAHGETVSCQNDDPRYRVHLCWPEKAINSSLNRFWFMAPKSTPTIVLDCEWKVSLYATIQNQSLRFFNIFHWYAVNRFFKHFFVWKSCVVLKAVEMIVLCECYKELIVVEVTTWRQLITQWPRNSLNNQLINNC